jgi:hypothetical protein
MTTIFGEKATREELVEALARRMDLKAYIKGMQEELDDIDAMLKAALEEDPTPIVDGERGISAYLKERSKGAEFDLLTFASKPENERHLVALAQYGCLSARVTQLRGLRGKSAAVDALLAIEAPAGVSHILTVEQS